MMKEEKRKKHKERERERGERYLPIAPSSRQTLQHRPGKRTGSSHVGLGHSFLMFLHKVRPAIRFFFWTCRRAKRMRENEPRH